MAIDQEQRIKHCRVMQLSQEILDFLNERPPSHWFKTQSDLAGFLEERLFIGPKKDRMKSVFDNLVDSCRRKDEAIGDLLTWIHDLYDQVLFLNEALKAREA
jgi:hypothetical protein